MEFHGVAGRVAGVRSPRGQRLLAQPKNYRAPRRHQGVRYSVVTAIYNADKFLDQFFASIVAQTLNFAVNVEIIAVDDGSTDRSAKTVKRWQRKHPKNIKYMRKENGGPASARNVGLEAASGAWITFIDADDFVAADYFARVDEVLEKDRDDRIAMVSCNYIIFDELSGTNRDIHPLRYRFAAGERTIAIGDIGRDIQVTVNSAFMRRALIEEHQLRFDERIRPGFEDTHFAGRYLLRAWDMSIVYLPTAEYFHRRRSDRSSLQDTARARREQYDDELKYGYLDLLRDAQSREGRVPTYFQNTVLFALSFAFAHAVQQPESLSFLGNAGQQRYRDLLAETFSYIDLNTLIEYNLSYLPFFYRLGILKLLKKSELPYRLAEITDFDTGKNLFRVAFWTSEAEPDVVVRVDDETIVPAFAKRRCIFFLGSVFAWEHIYWLPIERIGGELNIFVEGRDARIEMKGKRYVNGLPLALVRQAFAAPELAEALLPPAVRTIRKAARSPKVVARYENAWLFMDRDTEADDSAEHLYRYVRHHHPEINAFFVLRQTSPDWPRFAGEGHRRLAYSEPEHILALLNATHLLSSHIDQYIWGFLDEASFGDLLRYKLVFLQHGVTQGDYSRLLNFAPIDCLITSTFGEFDSIVGDPSPYKFTKKEVVLTGLPRHDILLGGPITDSRTIVIMPTWRLSLTGPSLTAGNARSINPAFYQSEFATRWKSVLHSPRLAAAAKRGGYKIVFVAHPNNEPYIDFLDIPRSIEVQTFSQGKSLQATFQQLSVFVTDYSSKAFDAAYLEKQVIYYQFDREVVFGGGHLSAPGYFDYERDGFGPVYREEADLLYAIDRIADGVGGDPVYRARAAKTFAFRDGKSRQRVVEAVMALGASTVDK